MGIYFPTHTPISAIAVLRGGHYAVGAAALKSLEAGGVAVVFGASGGIGAALFAALQDAGQFETSPRLQSPSAVPIDTDG